MQLNCDLAQARADSPQVEAPFPLFRYVSIDGRQFRAYV